MVGKIQKEGDPPHEDFFADCRLLEQSGLFDWNAYRARAGLIREVDAVEHYLLTGWRIGFEPEPSFEGGFLYPYFRSVGFDGPPALTYVYLRTAGWPVYKTRVDSERVACDIRASRFFDEDLYTARVNCRGMDPALHYVIVGEQMGFAPSKWFDPVYYRKRYSDIESGISLLRHFLAHGQLEGRRPVSVASEFAFDTSGLDPARATVLVVMHQASRTGAPILAYNIVMRLRARYNIVGLLLAGGNLLPEFERCCSAIVGPISSQDWSPVEAEYLSERLVSTYQISYAIANTIDSRIMFKPLTCALVPVVALIHEFASHVTPKGEMGRALEWATEIVFSAQSVAASALADYPNLENRKIHILPQGQSSLPPAASADMVCEEKQALRAKMQPPGAESAFVVLGCGTIFLRKGVDLFLSCAAAVARLNPERPVRFVWIGPYLPPEVDGNYATLLSEQIARSGLRKIVAIIDEVADLEPAYAAADLFFLSSRLDPLPNVAIDAALRGLPVVCFENAGGMADLLAADQATSMSVVSYLDVEAAARLIVKLATDEAARQDLSTATQRLAQATFDMDAYVSHVDRLGHDAARIMTQRAKDLATISGDPMFDATSFLGHDATVTTREQAIRIFLARSAALGTGKRPTVNFYYRRPCPGFHPQIYAHENSDHYDIATVNPLAHFIRSGKPSGPWRHEVIVPNVSSEKEVSTSSLSVALHGHFYYPEFFADFIRKLKANRSRCDLLLSTNDHTKADVLRAATEGYDRGRVVIRIVPNRGRDMGPFLTSFREDIAFYDVVGHVHGKRSLSTTDPALGESWREFLWQNLLGNICPMMDVILDRLAADEGIGMIFPDDPHLSDWDHNREIAEHLAKRMGLADPLPPFLNFPIGAMFWARPQALEPLLALGLNWSDYPDEPLAIDGTILHAVERLLPFAARHAGYRYATTHIPGITW